MNKGDDRTRTHMHTGGPSEAVPPHWMHCEVLVVGPQQSEQFYDFGLAAEQFMTWFGCEVIKLLTCWTQSCTDTSKLHTYVTQFAKTSRSAGKKYFELAKVKGHLFSYKLVPK